MEKDDVKVEFITPTSPDFIVVENLFGLMTSRLADRPMRTLDKVKAEVNR